MDIKKILEAIGEKNLSIKDLDVLSIVPNAIEGVVITVIDGAPHAHLPKDMNGDRYKKWIRGRGGIFFKDVKKKIANKECGKYILLEGDGRRMIARIIEETELDLMKALIDGKIKDTSYTVLRTLGMEDSLVTSKCEPIYEEIEESPEILVEDQENSNDGEVINVSLFED